MRSGSATRPLSRSPTSTAQHETEGDLFYAELRFGADFRYQKNLTFQLLFENQSVFDGNLIDDRSNTSNPGGTDVFGRAASTENPGFRVERFWMRYKFEGTPVTLFVGAELKKVSQAGIFGNDDPGIGLEAEFGNLELSAKAYIERESQRLGLQNDNDLVSYVFTAAYDLRPHRFGFDVVYFRDRFFGADTAAVGCDRPDIGCTGQKSDSVWIDASWTGRFGPVRGAAARQRDSGDGGRRHRGTAGTGVLAGREYDIFAGSVIGYVEVDLGVVRPFVLGVYGSADGDPRDRQLHGFGDVQPQGDSTQWATGMLAHLDKSSAAGGTAGLFVSGAVARGADRTRPRTTPMPLARASRRTRLRALLLVLPLHECYHTVSNLWNARPGEQLARGDRDHLLEPGDAACLGGVKDVPGEGARDHRLVRVSGHGALQPARDGVCAGNPGRSDSQDSQGSVPRNWGLLEVDSQSAL